MAPSTKKKKSAIKRRKKRALANVQPSSPSYYQQQQEDEEDDEKETTNGDINIETSTNQSHYHDQLVEKDKDSSFIGDNNKPITKNSTKESKEEMAGDKETGDSESGKVHTEFPRKSDKGGSSSSSDSSSDDESKISKKIRSSKKKVLGVFKDRIAGISNAFAGILPSEDKVENIVSSSEDSVEKIVSSVEEKVEGSCSILPASVPPGVDTSYDGGENSEVPETPESPEKQELLPIVPTTVQPASWKSCCGLFDVLTGSNR